MNQDKNFSSLVNETYRSLVFFLRYLGLPPDEAEDMTQEVFIKAHKSFEKYDSNRSFKSWLFSIAKNTFIDWTRHQKVKQKFLRENFCKDYCESFETQSNNSLHVKKILAELSADEQVLIELRFFQEMPFKEIAQLTGMTHAATKMRVCRILDKLREKTGRQQNEQ